MRLARRKQRGFSLIELIVSMAIVAVLVSLLLPALRLARDAAQTTVCASNLRQMGFAWRLYLDDYRQFPKHTALPDWNFGGAEFRPNTRTPYLAEDRPLNAYIAQSVTTASERLATQFRCPSDWGVGWDMGPRNSTPMSVLGDDETCFEFFGTSYRANLYLLDASLTGIDPSGRPLREAETTTVPTSKLLLTADAVWYYATRQENQPGDELDASWHGKYGAGNMLAMDGGVRFIEFEPGETTDYFLYPRPGRGPTGLGGSSSRPPGR
ncbi:MAG: prepilin-type N-terminal cleavage/methylation domain-containing protein [Planctomycetes bacterium]|nr:prepilin-type N-terminal cleavage/methylation domain-containing protein [Planctomycetota bacterium]